LPGGGGAAVLRRHDLVDRLHVVFDGQAGHGRTGLRWRNALLVGRQRRGLPPR
jgi:hypothetical protein